MAKKLGGASLNKFMHAEILDPAIRFEVAPAPREDGTIGPPLTISITARPCWRKPAVKLELAYAYESQEGVVYYYVVERK